MCWKGCMQATRRRGEEGGAVSKVWLKLFNLDAHHVLLSIRTSPFARPKQPSGSGLTWYAHKFTPSACVHTKLHTLTSLCTPACTSLQPQHAPEICDALPPVTRTHTPHLPHAFNAPSTHLPCSCACCWRTCCTLATATTTAGCRARSCVAACRPSYLLRPRSWSGGRRRSTFRSGARSYCSYHHCYYCCCCCYDFLPCRWFSTLQSKPKLPTASTAAGRHTEKRRRAFFFVVISFHKCGRQLCMLNKVFTTHTC